MQLLDAPAAKEMFDTLFNSSRRTMFKAEVLQDYSVIDDSPSLRAWASGDTSLARKLAAIDEDIIAWRNRCLASPAAITRVHIVEEPLTTYLEWEIAVTYRESLLRYEAEDVRLVAARELNGLAIPDGDFWIFDDAQVLEWIYDTSGVMAGAKVWSSGEDIAGFLELKKILLAQAEPVPRG